MQACRKESSKELKMGRVVKKKLAEVLQAVDPNLNIVSSHKKRSWTTRHDWARLVGVTSPTCGKELLRTYGLLKQCYKCFSKQKGIFLEGIECPKCERRAAKVTTLSDGLQGEKVICPNCGTYTL